MKKIEKITEKYYSRDYLTSKINELCDAVNGLLAWSDAMDKNYPAFIRPKKEPECEHVFDMIRKSDDYRVCSKCGVSKPNIRKDGLAERLWLVHNNFEKLADEARAWAVEVVENAPSEDGIFQCSKEELIKRLKESA